jgi:hypothetical protein
LEKLFHRLGDNLIPDRGGEVISENIHMEVAIPYMTIAYGAEAVVLTEAFDLGEEGREVGPRDHGVFFLIGAAGFDRNA